MLAANRIKGCIHAKDCMILYHASVQKSLLVSICVPEKRWHVPFKTVKSELKQRAIEGNVVGSQSHLACHKREASTPLSDIAAVDEEAFEEVYEGLPPLELITGRISRVEEYGVFVDFVYKEKKYSGLLHVSEMKAPAGKVAEELSKGAVEKYVDVGEITNAADYYEVGDEVEALFLGTEEGGRIALSQYMDWEVAEDDGDDLLASSSHKEWDASEEDSSQGADGDATTADDDAPHPMGFADNTARAGAGVGVLASASGQLVSPAASLPSRPVSTEAIARSLSSVSSSEVDIDLSLNDVSSSEWLVPPNMLKKTGLRLQEGVQGNMEVIAKEGKKATSEARFAALLDAAGSLNTRVHAFFADLMEPGVNEAELLKRAYRRPIAL